jgi:glycosyltransferase involved in cell wall biosynthesis
MTLPFDDVVLYAHSPLRPVAFPVDRFRVELGGPRLPDPMWEAWTLRRRARQVAVLFSPSYTLPVACPGTTAVTCFGPSENPRWSFESWRARAYERLYRHSARRAKHVFTAAECVRKRVVAEYGVPAERVEVIPLAAGRDFKPVTDEGELWRVRLTYLGAQTPYVLFVGKLSGRHRIRELVSAFAALKTERDLPHKLLVVGPDVVGTGVPQLGRSLGVGDAVVHVPYMPYVDLPATYSAADAFVFPVTEAEGFGIPVIEAMACGTAVISTDRGSVPEFATGAALLVPSASEADLRQGLATVLADHGLREDLRRRGLEGAAQYSWRRTAERTMAALWRLAKPEASG